MIIRLTITWPWAKPSAQFETMKGNMVQGISSLNFFQNQIFTISVRKQIIFLSPILEEPSKTTNWNSISWNGFLLRFGQLANTLAKDRAIENCLNNNTSDGMA
jgi:hypothetical protein